MNSYMASAKSIEVNPQHSIFAELKQQGLNYYIAGLRSADA